MVVFNSLEEIANIEPCCVALGNFDGVHVGHQSLIRQTVAKAKEHGLKSAVFTFSTHPKNLIPGRKPVKNIIYQDEKADLIEALGVDYLFNIEFTAPEKINGLCFKWDTNEGAIVYKNLEYKFSSDNAPEIFSDIRLAFNTVFLNSANAEFREDMYFLEKDGIKIEFDREGIPTKITTDLLEITIA